jgi:hypothetical protein
MTHAAFLQIGESWVRVDLIEAVGALNYADGSTVRTITGNEYSDRELPPAAIMARLALALELVAGAA